LKSKICLVCYDVSNNKERRDLANLILEFGKRIQESVFLCDLREERMAALEQRLKMFYARSSAKKKKAMTKAQKSALGIPSARQATNNANANDTLDILMITLDYAALQNALVLGAAIDCGLQFTVI